MLYDNGHEALIVRKSLLSPKGDSREDWLRIYIFHTTYTIVDRVYKVTINIGSYENRVFDEAIQK